MLKPLLAGASDDADYEEVARMLVYAQTLAYYFLGPLTCPPSTRVSGVAYVLGKICPVTAACYNVYAVDPKCTKLFASRNDVLVRKLTDKANGASGQSEWYGPNVDVTEYPFSSTEGELFATLKALLDKAVPLRPDGDTSWWAHPMQLSPRLRDEAPKPGRVIEFVFW
jgi:hypothetical protein